MKKIIALLTCLCIFAASGGGAVVSAQEELDGSAQIQQLLSALEIMQGYPDGSFHPEQMVTRAEFAKIAVAASEYRNSVSSVSYISPFKDVSYQHWAASYVKVASANGFISGYPDSTFRPENNVTLEEAVTVCVQLLGYTDEDFGISWPEGQLNLATTLELLDGIDKVRGEALTRGDVMQLMYNTLNCQKKNSTQKAIESFGYQIAEDITLIATTTEDPSVPKNKVVATAGTYQIDDSFDTSLVGQKGDAVLKNGDELVIFLPAEMQREEYPVYTTLNNDLIIYDGGQTRALGLGENTTAYYKSQASTLSALLLTIKQGDSVTIYRNYMGTVEYIVIKENETAEPVVVYDGSWAQTLGVTEDTNILRDGAPSSIAEIAVYDVIYYSPQLNTVWAYSTKATGIFEQAVPNQEQPESIVLSGTTYGIETLEAFNQLSVTGDIKLDDKITVLLGRNGEIVKVLEDGMVNTDQYIVYSKLGSEIIAYADGALEQLDLDKTLTAYYNKQQTTFSNALSMIEEGDIISVIYDGKGNIDYVLIETGSIKGPYTVTGSSFAADYGIKEDAVYLRDGQSVSKSEILNNDILYYSEEMNVVWAYNKKVTGVYEKASPTQNSPTSITVSGKEYEVESVAAFNKLVSGGTFSLGDTVVLLLGKDGGVADVIAVDESTYEEYGYLIGAGSKLFENSQGDAYSSNYVTFVNAAGDTYEFQTERDYEDYVHSIVRVTLENGVATVNKATTKATLTGTFDAQGGRIGSTKLADDVQILDVTTTSLLTAGAYTTVFKQRLDGVQFENRSVLYFTSNENSEVDRIFLNDMTGDAFQYGVVTSTKQGYVCDVAGQILNASGSYAISAGQPAKFIVENGTVQYLRQIDRLDKKVVDIDSMYLYTDDGQKYRLSDQVVIYDRSAEGEWRTIPLEDVDLENRTLVAYYDMAEKYGGRIRVIVMTVAG